MVVARVDIVRSFTRVMEIGVAGTLTLVALTFVVRLVFVVALTFVIRLTFVVRGQIDRFPIH